MDKKPHMVLQETVVHFEKPCKKCKVVKSLVDFPKSKKFKSGINSICKDCRNLEQRNWVRKNPEKIRKINSSERAKSFEKTPERKLRLKDNALRREYGISLESFNQMIKNQNGACKICLTILLPRAGKHCVDHDHKTGFVRGILCQKCNSGIGMFNDNPELLKIAIGYLGGQQ